MLELNPHHSHLSFPDPFNKGRGRSSGKTFVGTKVPLGRAAWVSLIGEGYWAKGYRLHFPYPKGSVFFSESIGEWLDAGVTQFREQAKQKWRTDLQDGESHVVWFLYADGTVPKSSIRFLDSQDDLAQYKRMCLKFLFNEEYVPFALVSADATCPGGSLALDKVSSDKEWGTMFRPASYKYMSYWVQAVVSQEKQKILLRQSIGGSAVLD